MVVVIFIYLLFLNLSLFFCYRYVLLARLGREAAH